MINDKSCFISSLILKNHPMKRVKYKIKKDYYAALQYFVRQVSSSEFTNYRLKQYYRLLNKASDKYERNVKPSDEKICSIINNRLQPWRKKYRFIMICDMALILFDKSSFNKAVGNLKSYLNKRQQRQVDQLTEVLQDKNQDMFPFEYCKELIDQFHINKRFSEEIEQKYVVTATVSAGKSTLINALVGKSLLRTAQEVCTGNNIYIYNKPYEDETIHLYQSENLMFDADENVLHSINQKQEYSMAVYFNFFVRNLKRICIVDTPGVNTTLIKQHRKITKEILKKETYSKLIYILNANKLGTDEEFKYLKWIHENISDKEIIFVLNKVDDFRQSEDDIETSIRKIRKDLLDIGYSNPTIYPISAYFALLIKKRWLGETLSEDEEDDYSFFCRKFTKPMYDLSQYYKEDKVDLQSNQYLNLSAKCGLYGLEKLLFGGEK